MMAWYMIRPGEVLHGMWKCLCEFHVLWHCFGLFTLGSDSKLRDCEYIYVTVLE